MTDGLTASDVAVLTGGTGRNDGFGGDWGAWIILFLIFGVWLGRLRRLGRKWWRRKLSGIPGICNPR